MQDDYGYFAYPPLERGEAVKKKIEEREKSLFELHMMREMLEGNPNPGEHLEADERTVVTPQEKFVRPCTCGACELGRLNDAILGLEFGLNKLRALHGRMTG
jgi:hypothetical protein